MAEDSFDIVMFIQYMSMNYYIPRMSVWELIKVSFEFDKALGLFSPVQTILDVYDYSTKHFRVRSYVPSEN